MARYEINGGHPLNGTVTISGAKNAAVAILPAALLVSGKCRIENVPNISDVRILMSILDGMGAKMRYPGTRRGGDRLRGHSLQRAGSAARPQNACQLLSDGRAAGAVRQMPMWRCPAAAISPPVPLTSTSRAFWRWAQTLTRRKNMSL